MQDTGVVDQGGQRTEHDEDSEDEEAQHVASPTTAAIRSRCVAPWERMCR